MANPKDAKQYLQKLQTFAYLNIGIPLLFFIYTYLESSAGQLIVYIPEEYHIAVLILTILICAYLFYWSYKKQKNYINKAFSTTKLKEKLEVYFNANKNRFLSYGFIAWLLSFSFYLTDHQAFAAIFGVLLVLFSINNPSTHKIVRDLKLKGKDKEIIFDGLEIQ